MFSKASTLLKLPNPGPYIVYADAEATLVNTNDPRKMHKHVINLCCLYLVCTFDSSNNRLWHDSSPGCVEKMIVELSKTRERRYTQEVTLSLKD